MGICPPEIQIYGPLNPGIDELYIAPLDDFDISGVPPFSVFVNVLTKVELNKQMKASRLLQKGRKLTQPAARSRKKNSTNTTSSSQLDTQSLSQNKSEELFKPQKKKKEASLENQKLRKRIQQNEDIYSPTDQPRKKKRKKEGKKRSREDSDASSPELTPAFEETQPRETKRSKKSESEYKLKSSFANFTLILFFLGPRRKKKQDLLKYHSLPKKILLF